MIIEGKWVLSCYMLFPGQKYLSRLAESHPLIRGQPLYCPSSLPSKYFRLNDGYRYLQLLLPRCIHHKYIFTCVFQEIKQKGDETGQTNMVINSHWFFFSGVSGKYQPHVKFGQCLSPCRSIYLRSYREWALVSPSSYALSPGRISGFPYKRSLPLGWRYCLFRYTPRANSVPNLLIFSFSSYRPFPFKKFSANFPQ